MRTTKRITVRLPPGLAKDAALLAKHEKRSMSGMMVEAFREYRALRQQMDDYYSDERIAQIIEDAKRNPMTPEEAEAEDRRLRQYGAAQAKKLGIKERDIPEIIRRFRARNRAS